MISFALRRVISANHGLPLGPQINKDGPRFGPPQIGENLRNSGMEELCCLCPRKSNLALPLSAIRARRDTRMRCLRRPEEEQQIRPPCGRQEESSLPARYRALPKN